MLHKALRNIPETSPTLAKRILEENPDINESWSLVYLAFSFESYAKVIGSLYVRKTGDKLHSAGGMAIIVGRDNVRLAIKSMQEKYRPNLEEVEYLFDT